MGRVLAMLLVVVGLCVPRVSAAQGTPASKREARKLLKQGDRSFKRGEALEKRSKANEANAKYQEALGAYKKAYEVYPNPQIYFTIARAEEKLGLYADAHRHYLRLLEEATEIRDDLRAAVELRLDEVLKKLSQLTVDASPAGAKIFVDDDELGEAPVKEALVLEPGEHELVVRAEGHTPYETKVTLKAGEVRKTKVELKPVQVVDDTPKPKPTKLVLKKKPTEGRGLLIAGLATSATLAAAATITGIIAVSKHGTFTDDQLPSDERSSARDSGKTLALTTDVLIAATVVSGAITTYYYYGVYRPRKERNEIEYRRARQRSVWMTPYVGRDSGGLAVGGSF